jgi:hypothetical protein
MIPLFVLPYTLVVVVLASSTCGDQHFLLSLRCADHHPIRIGDGRERLTFFANAECKRDYNLQIIFRRSSALKTKAWHLPLWNCEHSEQTRPLLPYHT